MQSFIIQRFDFALIYFIFFQKRKYFPIKKQPTGQVLCRQYYFFKVFTGIKSPGLFGYHNQIQVFILSQLFKKVAVNTDRAVDHPYYFGHMNTI
jgi:hypothetical protein